MEPRSKYSMKSALDAGRAALGKGHDLFDRRHRGVAGKRRQQRAVRPAEIDGFLLGRAAQQAIEKSCGITVTATNAVHDIKLAHRRLIRLAIHPRDRAPSVAVGRMYIAQR